MLERSTDGSRRVLVLEQEEPWRLSSSPTRLRNTLGVVGICVPIAAYFWFLHHFALNVIFWDQWSDIYTANHDWLSNLWSQHDVHRIFFPNIVVVVLADYSHFNVVLEEFISAGCLVAATSLFVLAHRRRVQTTSWLFYVPVVAVMLSLNQVQNTLWGFQLAWYMVLLALAATMYVIDWPTLSWVHIGVAVAIAVGGSFSSLMGLFIWPVGLFMLLQRRRRRGFVFVWIGSALITAAIYFHGFSFNQPTSGKDKAFALQHPLFALKYVIFGLGGGVGLPPSPIWLPMLFGAVLLAVSVGALVLYGFRRDKTSGRTIGVALILFGLLFVGSTALGRAWAGLFFSSRYNTFYFLLLVGSYFALTDRSEPAVAEDQRPPRERGDVRRSRADGASWQTVLLVVVAVLLCIEVVSGSHQGIEEARSWTAQQRLVAAVTLNIGHAPDSLLDSAQLYPGAPPSFLRTVASEAETKQLSLFGTAPPADVLHLERGTARLIEPKPNSVLHGNVTVFATATAGIGVSRTTFRLTGPELPHPSTLGPAIPAAYVWISRWDSRTVPDGSYELQAVADTSIGTRFLSPTVPVRVEN
jgi:hypothetical protein